MSAPAPIPAALEALSDQPRVRDFLATALAENRLSHAYLFLGPPGAGKHEAAEAYDWEPVNVLPQPKAGGSFATTCWQNFTEPVAVEHIRAHAGMDIGSTLIGMHLREVAVPVRIAQKTIGEAPVVCARTRLKCIGGVRAHYQEDHL